MTILKALNLALIFLFCLNYNSSSQSISKDFCSYETDGTGKAKGLKVKMKYPCAWKSSETSYPNTVRHFSTVINKKSVLIQCNIQRLPQVTEADRNQLFDHKIVKQAMESGQPGLKILLMKNVKINQLEALHFVSERHFIYNKKDMYSFDLSILIPYKNFLLGASYSVTGSKGDELEVQKEYKELESMFSSLANQVEILN